MLNDFKKQHVRPPFKEIQEKTKSKVIGKSDKDICKTLKWLFMISPFKRSQKSISDLICPRLKKILCIGKVEVEYYGWCCIVVKLKHNLKQNIILPEEQTG